MLETRPACLCAVAAQVGDPGLGKSQLLQAAAAAAPRGVYVCGNTSSAAGLTVSVVRENGEVRANAWVCSGGWSRPVRR